MTPSTKMMCKLGRQDLLEQKESPAMFAFEGLLLVVACSLFLIDFAFALWILPLHVLDSTTWIDFQGFVFFGCPCCIDFAFALFCVVFCLCCLVLLFFTICKLQKYIDLLYFSKTKVNNIIANVDKGTL